MKPRVCMECSAPAVMQLRPGPGQLEDFLDVHACEEHVGKVLTWMQYAGWRTAIVTALDPQRTTS